MESSRDQNIYKKIDAYVKGSLSEEEIELLWNEFAKDPSLLDHLELEVGVKKIIREKTVKKTTPAKIHSLPNWVWHASAAAVIVLVALVQLFRVETPQNLQDFVVTSIPNQQLEIADNMRSEASGISEADSLLNLGFAAVSSGNTEEALFLFSEVIRKFNSEPYASKAYLNKGIINYNDGLYDEAIVNFEESAERAKENRMISEKAYWYLGNAYINVDQPEKALVAIGEAYNRNGIFRKPAFLLYRKLSYDLGKTDVEQPIESN